MYVLLYSIKSNKTNNSIGLKIQNRNIYHDTTMHSTGYRATAYNSAPLVCGADQDSPWRAAPLGAASRA